MVGDVTYTYLSDGTRLSARKANGVGVITRGSFSYAIDASGAIRLESVGHSEGRIYVGNSGELKDCWNISDHLGNVRSVINPSKDGTNTVESLIDPQLMIDESSKLYYGGKLPAAYIISSPYLN